MQPIMGTSRYLSWMLPLLFALLLSCGWDPFSNGEEPADTAKENPTDTLQGKRICVTIRSFPDESDWGFPPLRLGDYEVRMSIPFGVVSSPNTYIPSTPLDHSTDTARYRTPKFLWDLITSTSLRVEVYNFGDRRVYPQALSRLDFALYRALVSPEVTYKNTVWGKLRKRGSSTYYAWHAIDFRKIGHPYTFSPIPGKIRDVPWLRFPHYILSKWNPNHSITWSPGVKEVYDDLAKHVSLTIPLTEEWEAYDLEFIPTVGRPPWAEDTHLPEHVRQSFVPGNCEAVQDTRLSFKYVAAGPCPTFDYDDSGQPTLCFTLRRR